MICDYSSLQSSGLGVTPSQITTPIGASLLTAAPFTGPAAPFVAAAGLLTTLVGGLFQPDVKKQQATAIVNQIESQVLTPNLLAWQALAPQDKTLQNQQLALATFDNAWQAVLQGCGNPQLGSAGVNCIADRQRGSTKGYDWFKLYRDPIANDQIYTPPVNQTINTAVSQAGGDINSLISSVTGSSNTGSYVIPIILAGLGIWALSELV